MHETPIGQLGRLQPVTRICLEEDPSDWSVVAQMTLVCITSTGATALTPSGGLPSGVLLAGEHPLDACLRIPLDQAGFRYQHFHPFALDGGHLYGWVEGELYHRPVVVPRLGRPSDPAEAQLVDEALADHAVLPAAVFYRESVRTLERAYLQSDNPRGQSGFSGDEAAWRARRQQVADAIDRSGTFLDIGCANGHLAESVADWCAQRGLEIDPYGVDLAPRLVELAKARLPHLEDHFWVGNGIDWVHPTGRRFDFVHILLDCAPRTQRAQLIDHHLKAVVAPSGRLLISDWSAPAGAGVDDQLSTLGYRVGGHVPSHDPNRRSAGTAWIAK